MSIEMMDIKENEMSQKLAGKVAVVTGASKGIGAQIAKRFAQEGAKVVVNYSSSKAGAAKVVEEITAAGGQAVPVKADMRKRAEIVAMFEETAKAFGPADILVNNAGVYRFSPLGEVDEAHFHEQMGTLKQRLSEAKLQPAHPAGAHK